MIVRGNRNAATIVAAAIFLAGVVVVEAGIRDPGASSRSLSHLPIPSSLIPVVERLRAQPHAAISDPRSAAIASGVIFGRTEHVDAETEADFLSSGLWHLLAASGQNVALVAGSCVVLATILGGTRVHGAVLALVAVPSYVLVVGGGASIVRAGIMAELLLIAWLAGMRGDVVRTIAWSAAAICWLWPGAHRLLGFQLSFACVMALVAAAPHLQRWLQRVGVHPRLAGALSASAVCALATAPVLQLRTGSAPLVGTAANVVAVPLAAMLLVIGLAGSVWGMLVPGLAGDVPLAAAGLIAGMLRMVAGRAADLPLASTSNVVVTIGGPILIVALAACGLARRRSVARVGVPLLLVLALGAALSPTAPVLRMLPGASDRVPPPAKGVLRVAALDVGQGDATLLMHDGSGLLVDTGPPGGGVAVRAREAGVRRLDAIVLTHDSLDHRGGLEQAVAQLQPERIVIPRDALGDWRRVRALGLEVEEVCAGDHLTVGSVRTSVLSPPCGMRVPNLTGDQHNDNAMVLLVEHAGIRVLLTADAESPPVLPLNVGPVDVLRVAHHGSRDDRLPELLANLAPTVAVVSVGEGNEYGHPTPSTLAALDRAGARVLRTDRHGSVVLDVARGDIVLR